MAFNYGPPPGAFGQQASYGAPPGVPGMGMPPNNIGAPGIPGHSPAPGLAFQAPPNIPGLDFSAPLIRLGHGNNDASRVDSRGGRRDNEQPMGNRNRAGLGSERGPGGQDDRRGQVREAMTALQPPTREEVARTIFIGGLGEGTPDDDEIEAILRCAGGLRRWARAVDAEGKPCKFGFAEYEDSDSLEAASEILQDVEVPLREKGVFVKEEDGELKKVRLLVVVDEASHKYIQEWQSRKDPAAREFRLETARDDLKQCLVGIANASAHTANGAVNGDNIDPVTGEIKLDGAEVINIPLQVEDELSDIPAEMRATVSEEIKAFRDRSTRRDLDRVKREEEMEAQERARSRPSRLASPPLTAPSGPAGTSANGVPVGPRGSRIEGAPAGPKGYRGAQMPSDYANGVAFVGPNGTNGIAIDHENDDDPAPDEELEQRRKEKRQAELEKQYLDAERRWLNRERTRAAAQEREKAREESEETKRLKDKETVRRQLKEWDDDEEARQLREEYYIDRSIWLRNRNGFRAKEAADDSRDRAAEERENDQHSAAKDMADEFLGDMEEQLERKAAEQQQQAGAGGFKMSLGNTRRAPEAKRKPIADVEGLLEDEEDAAAAGTRQLSLKPLTDLSTIPTRGEDMSEADVRAAQQALAAEIPTSTTQLFAFPLQWKYLTADLVEKNVRPMVEKKIMDYLGVQEDMLVGAVVDHVAKKGKPEELVEELSVALEDDAVDLVRKVWRMLAFYSESEARGFAS